MKSMHSDEAIVAEFLSTRKAHLFAELHRRYSQKVFQTCFQFLRNADEAHDQTQEIFCKVFTRLDTFRGEAKFSTWLFSLTRYHCLSVLDTMKRRSFVSLDTISELMGGYVELDEPTLDERWHQAEHTLGRLSVSDQALLRRRYLADKDVATLAGEAQISLSAMKMRLKRARDMARAIRMEYA